ncbi:TPA: hypothetical protein ACH3X1_008740 [Trebouxia sp. C0004]
MHSKVRLRQPSREIPHRLSHSRWTQHLLPSLLTRLGSQPTRRRLLVDLFSEYYESDKIDMDFLTNDKSCNGDIDFEHAAFTNPGVAAAVPTNTRAELGSNTEDYDIDNMISYD